MPYSIKWQKRGLPHAHILVRLVRKITLDEIDNIISAETIDRELFEVVTKHMIHGLCDVLNMNSPCMVDGICSKRYPRALTSDTVTSNDGYPLHQRRSTEDNGQSAMMKICNR